MGFLTAGRFTLSRGGRDINPTAAIAVVAFLCGSVTALFVSEDPISGGFFIATTCLLGAWSGTADPGASLNQIRRGWRTGALLACAGLAVLGSVTRPGMPNAWAIAGLFATFVWVIVAVPATGILFVLVSRRWQSEKNWGDLVFLLASAVVLTLAPVGLEELFYSFVR